MHYSQSRLTDYEIADAFQPILSGLYKKKMDELHGELFEVYAHLDRLDIPKYSDFHRRFARKCLPERANFLLKSIEHIQRIRKIKVNDTKNDKTLDIAKAKAVPIESFYTPTVKRGRQITCPLHTDNSPSMIINKNNTVKCFSCGFYGDSINLFMAINKVNFSIAIRSING